MFPDFVPIEMRGMSIVTAVILFFYASAGGFIYSLYKREFKRVYNMLKAHNEKLETYQENISDMKTKIALTYQSVTRIERILEKQDKH